ncbi:MAG TPA: SusC/RagA family TonB-linked outer membrane protein, partial [Hanamia sp.]|nr:SusC/RagA family TonB-linked outer membrane protein [Hanamia sp.]
QQAVVVVGYGTQRKSDVSGSVAQVNVGRSTAAVPTTNVAEMLRGQAAGVQVTEVSARPGGTSNILIRGVHSILGGNAPLIVLDGFPIDNINDVNADDIASIDVLKDAAAQAIYGARAANGVILITTKRGKVGKMKVNYSGVLTTQKLHKNFDLYSGEEFAQLRREAQRTSNAPDFTYLADSVIFDDFELQSLKDKQFVNWEKLVLRTALLTNHNLSVSGGTENTKVFASASYFGQSGLIPSSGYQRGSFRVNLDQKINDKINFQTHINFLKDKQEIESSSLDFITISPLAKPYDSAGNLNEFPLGPNSLTVNPLWNIRESTNDLETNLYNVNLVFNYKIVKGLSYKLNTLISRTTTDQGIYLTSKHPQGVTPHGVATVANGLRNEYLIENIFNYDKNINENNRIEITGVQSVNEIFNSNTTTIGTEFPNDLLGYNGISDAINKNTTRTQVRRRLSSFMGRIRYNLMDKYLLVLTGRDDGSSVFAQNKKRAFFPAVSAAWKINNESFFDKVNGVNELKLRASYGSVGNQAIAPYQTLGTVGSFPYVFGGVIAGGNIPASDLPNPNLTWETSTTFNVGIDFGLWQNRLSGSIEYYNTHTRDLLVDVTLAGTTGYATTITNGGESKNDGIGIRLSGDIIRKKDFNWNVTAIFSANKNEILKTGIVDSAGNPKDDVARNRFVGHPIDVIYQKKFDGIFQTQAEIDKSAQATQAGIIPGSVRVVDLNGDGKIDDNDNYIFKSAPDWYGSLFTSLDYKGIELLADFYIVEGAKKLNPWLAQYEDGGTLQGILNGIKVPYWTPEHHSDSYPRPQATTPSNLFALAVKNASYVRLRTLSLGYNLPRNILSKAQLDNIKIYVTANNLFTITNYKSYSPEVNPDAFPDAKTFTFGLNVGF